jgi:hypothetical protein
LATITYYAYEYDQDDKLVWSSFPITSDFKDMSEAYDEAERLVKQLQVHAAERGEAARFEVSKPLYDLEEVYPEVQGG